MSGVIVLIAEYYLHFTETRKSLPILLCLLIFVSTLCLKCMFFHSFGNARTSSAAKPISWWRCSRRRGFSFRVNFNECLLLAIASEPTERVHISALRAPHHIQSSGRIINFWSLPSDQLLTLYFNLSNKPIYVSMCVTVHQMNCHPSH